MQVQGKTWEHGGLTILSLYIRVSDTAFESNKIDEVTQKPRAGEMFADSIVCECEQIQEPRYL